MTRATHEGNAKLHSTRNATPTNAKQASIAALNACLADGIDLALALKQAHWNIKGSNFIGVHLMLDDMRKKQDALNDEMAERAVMLGGQAFGTAQTVADVSRLHPYPTDLVRVSDHLTALAERMGAVANTVRKAIDDTDEAGDATTADLFTQGSRQLDEMLWFLEAHLD